MLPAAATLLLLLSLPAALGHFGLDYPAWRLDTLAGALPAGVSQYNYPCAGVLSNGTGVPRTDWPLDGGSLKLDLHHAWTYIYVNLGLQLTEGATVSTFNITLTGPTFLNSTGNGTLCMPRLAIPAGFRPADGQRGSIQVVTVGASGSGLYNCADITFRANATTLPAAECVTSPGVSFYQVQSGPAGQSAATCPSPSPATTGGASQTSPSNTPSRTAAGASIGVNVAAVNVVAGMAALFVYGLA